jgi:hypothetical protein
MDWHSGWVRQKDWQKGFWMAKLKEMQREMHLEMETHWVMLKGNVRVMQMGMDWHWERLKETLMAKEKHWGKLMGKHLG